MSEERGREGEGARSEENVLRPPTWGQEDQAPILQPPGLSQDCGDRPGRGKGQQMTAGRGVQVAVAGRRGSGAWN